MTLVVVGMFVAFMLLELAGKSFGPQPNVAAGRLVTNFGLSALTAFFALLIPLSSVAAALAVDDAGFGLFNAVDAAWWVIFATAILSRTFANYWLHRAFHAVPLLWRLHRIHHSDTHFDLTLALRSHPLDYVLRISLFAGLTFALGLPVWAVIIGDLFLIATNFWEHVDGRLSPKLDRILGTVLATPNIHRLHHSACEKQTNSNYGGGVIIWDRLFGTYRCPRSESAERIGLGDTDDAMAQNLWRQLLLPLAPPPEAAEEVRSAR